MNGFDCSEMLINRIECNSFRYQIAKGWLLFCSVLKETGGFAHSRVTLMTWNGKQCICCYHHSVDFLLDVCRFLFKQILSYLTYMVVKLDV